MAASDIVVLTSDNKGTPISLIQAGLVRKPTVTTSAGSVNEIILDGRTGIITDLSAKSLAASVGLLIDDEGLRTEYGSAAFQYT